LSKMPLEPKSLRRWFAAGAILAVLVAAFFYLRGILKSGAVAKAPQSLPGNVEKSGKGFTFSQSEGGRTLFTIRAASFQQFKEGGKAELDDVSIIVYGREENRSDQIYGSRFSYDQTTGEVAAEGEVHIDLDVTSTGTAEPNQAPAQETKNVIHVKTSGLTFNRTSGIARTNDKIEFRLPEASGSAVGALYDSHKGLLTLKSAVKVVRADEQKSSLAAESATITKDPRTIAFHLARIEQPPRFMTTDRLSVLLRDDNTVDRIVAAGNVHAHAEGAKAFDVAAPRGELVMAAANQLRSGALAGGVVFDAQGDSPAHGSAGRLLLSFGPKGRLAKARAEDAVELTQGPAEKSQRLKAAAVDLFLSGNKLEKAVTSNGPAQIVFSQAAQKTTVTTISAGKFDATFSGQNRLSSVFGSPDARIVSATPGQPDRVALSRDIRATFDNKGQIAAADLAGDFHYQEGQRTATADQAHYNHSEESFALSGSPRVVDSGATITAEKILLNRRTGDAVAQGNVKTTYNDLKPQANGAMLASSEPVHVTGATATASRGAGVAHYTAARLWQGANIVEAPSLTFDKSHRSLTAQGDPAARVTSVFLSPGKNGADSTPVNVTADRLTYLDSDRKAVFSGKVLLRGEEFTMAADTVQVLLAPRGQAGNKPGNQLDHIVAVGDISIQEGERRARGSRLVYTAQEQKFVLTGMSGKKPSIFDAEHGQISGDSLTFYTRDGRVLVGSGESSHALTPTRIKDASAK
jgi:lipopolysaccharide export system protein LptA